MSGNQKFIDLSKELIASVDARDGLLMQQKMDALELAYKNEFPDRLGCYEDVFAYVLMSLASARYFAYNNMYGQVHARYDEVEKRMKSYLLFQLFKRHLIEAGVKPVALEEIEAAMAVLRSEG